MGSMPIRFRIGLKREQADVWDVAAIIGLGFGCLAGLLLTALRLPGTWLIIALAAAYGWWTDWQPVGAMVIGILVAAAVVAEVLEVITSVLIAKRAGASRRAGWGGLIGGMVGMIFLSLPVPLLGSVVGALLGCFAGAAIAELTVRKQLGQGAKVGVFAALGFALGAALKVGIALAMTGLLMTSVLLAKFGDRV